MQDTDMDDLLSQIATLMIQFERRFESIGAQQQALMRELDAFKQDMPTLIQQAASDALQTLPKNVHEKIDSGLAQTLIEYRQQYQTAGQQIGQGAYHIGETLGRVERASRSLVWKVMATTTTCLALLLGGGVWLSVHYIGVIRDNQMSTDTLKLYGAADLVRCGDRLCARIDNSVKRYGEHNEYVPVKVR